MDKPQGALTTTSTQAEIDIVDKLGAILATDEKTSHTRYLWYGDLGEGKTYLTGILHKILGGRKEHVVVLGWTSMARCVMF